jgi:hypothetical protein
MAITCLTGARFTMSATLLHQNSDYTPGYPDLDLYGEWVNSQDPLTGEIVRIWEPFPDVPDDPATPEIDPTVGVVPCLARGIVDGGIRVAGTTERFGDTYENIDFVKLWVPSWVRISKRDRVTNIKDKSGHIRWLNEEFDDPTDQLPPVATVFNVNGVTPLFNAFNDMTEQFVLLERAEVSTDANA